MILIPSAIGVLTLAGALTSAATLFGFAGRLGWLFELASHFRVQYFIVLALAACSLALLKAYSPAIFFAVFALINLSLIVPFYLRGPQIGAEGSPNLRVFQLNINMGNEKYGRVASAIDENDPDFVVLAEVNEKCLTHLKKLDKTYPYSIAEPRENDSSGIALFSRFPFSRAEVVYPGGVPVPSISVEVTVQSKRLSIFATHPLSPVSPKMARLRNRQLAAIGRRLRERRQPAVLVGDLNITPWSYYFRRLLRISRMRDSSIGFGILPTWPAGVFPLLIPIDHFLFSEGIRIRQKRIGPDVGSDHYPVIVDFELVD